MHASPTRPRCDVVIATAETGCADFQYDESLYDGSRFTLLLRLTRWHMWASHTAFITVHAFRISDAPGNARLATASGIGAGSSGRQVSQVDRQSEDRRCLQTISARWMDSCTFDLCQRRDDDDRAGLCRAVCTSSGCAALPRTTSPGSNDPGRRQQHRAATPTECVTRGAACAEPTHQSIHANP